MVSMLTSLKFEYNLLKKMYEASSKMIDAFSRKGVRINDDWKSVLQRASESGECQFFQLTVF